MANIVLVHGAFLDASSWAPVMPFLWQAGHRVIAVQNPTTTLEDDIASVKKALRELGNGPAVLAGHSYGGTVITAAASGEPDVIGLVYVAALANDRGQSVNDLFANAPLSDAFHAVRMDDEGWAILDRDAFPEVFASDVPREQARVMAASQQRLGPACFATPLPVEPAWKTIPSWYVLAEKDRVVSPELQLNLAGKIGATVIGIPSSHAATVSRPDAVANAINQAAARKARARS